MKKRIKRLIVIPLLVIALIIAVIPVASTSAARPLYIFTTVEYHINQVPVNSALYSINPSGDVVGVYSETFGGKGHGFSLVKGNPSTFDYPSGENTTLIGISPSGTIVGDYNPTGSELKGPYHWHGFMITKNGNTVDHAYAARKAALRIETCCLF